MKTKILSILALLLMTVTQGAWAQETLTVYDGTGTSQYIPMYGYSFDYYTKSECIIPASELTAMEGGTITAITFYAQSLEGSNSTFGTANQKVFLKEVSETTLSSYSGMEGATVVFDGTLPMPTTSASGYTITFSQGYTYNGGNLLIGIYNAAKGSWRKVFWYGNNNQSSGVSAFGYSTDNLAYVGKNNQTFLPKTTFTYTPADPNAGLLTGRFSVSATKQVQFSQGNLQYVGTWQFAANQYDIFGASQSDDHRDLFGWGTKTNPNNTSTTNGDYSWAEWGENTITNGCTGWRTLTKDEWGYLFTDRTNASTLRTFATVNSVTGLILMPDGWTASGVSLTITTANYTTNVLSTSQWATLEKQGCVFLPAAGGRAGTNVMNVGSIGDYWSSDASGETNAYDLNFSNNYLLPQNTAGQRHYGWSVRLVKDYIFTGLGTEASPYLIASTTDWNNLVSAVNGGETYSGNYFKMTANVGTVTTWMTGTFSGTFDGDGKTLTVDYSATTEKCAPFGTLGGASIQKLKVAGTITTNQKYAAGIAAYTTGTTYITNCLSSVAISSAVSGDGTHGGLVAVVDGYASLSMTGCAFTGKLLTTNSTTSCGGFVGFRWYTGTLTMTDCLYAPASATGSETWISDGEGQLGNANFSRWSNSTPTFTRCYYTTDFGSGNFTAQGIQARTIAAGDYVSTLSVTKGDATATYAVSGITVYSGGIDFNDGSTTTFYGGSGQTVSLALTAETRSGYQFKQYAASQGSLSGQTTDAPTLTMPAANSTANDVVTISAEYDPTYNATFATGNDNDGWDIDPEQQIEGGTVTVSYTGENKVKSVTVKANPSTLAGLKAAINDASDLTDLNTKVLGKYVTATGNIQSTSEGAVGIIAYISKTAVDNSFADSRIFVIATENASNSAAQAPSNAAETTYNSTSDLNGYAVTNAWQALDGYNASKAGWNYSASRPDGASHWFVPSYGQWMLGGWNDGNNRPCRLMRSTMEGSGQFYAVSTAINTEGNDTGYCVDGSWWGMGSIQRIQTIRVRAAFVY